MNPVNQLIVNFVKALPTSVVYLFAKKYIAGTQLANAVDVVSDLNNKGISATMDVLGEAISSKREAEESFEECIKVLEAIKKNNLDSNLSIKPTQLGLGINFDFCLDLVLKIVGKAKELNNFVRIDMEDSPYTEKTFELFGKVRSKYDNVGVVVQAYLKRTFDDVIRLNKERTNYRICKGIYIEPEEISYKDRHVVRDNFMKILEQMFEDGNYVGIATHDDYLVEQAYQLIAEKNIPKNKFEFQMLYGVKESLRDKINNDGYKMRVYVPYGEKWYPYSVRRLQENPQLAWYITKSLFSFK